MDKNQFFSARLALFACITCSSVFCNITKAATIPAQLTTTIGQNYVQKIYTDSHATGVAMVIVSGNKQLFFSAGQSQPGSVFPPTKHSLVRIASLTKLFTNEVMVKLSTENKVKLTDPLAKYLRHTLPIPTKSGHAIRLIDLATHSAGLPREMPGGKAHRPVFIWPTENQRLHWIQHTQLKSVPGAVASYSNIGYDLLADALQNAAGMPWSQLLKKQVTQPLQMHDTTYQPTAEQCARLLIPRHSSSPCLTTKAAIGSGGLYSTPDDMGRWLQQFLPASVNYSPLSAQLIRPIYRRDQLVAVRGMDVAGHADALGLGWVMLAANDTHPAMVEKTGGGGGFFTYIAMVPQQNIAVFVAVTRTSASNFSAMSNNVNLLVTELINNRPG